MGLEIEDTTGRPRPDSDLQEALHWVKKKIVKPDYSDPMGVIHCVTLKDALEELLALREKIRKAQP